LRNRAKIYVASGAAVKIFIDSPEHCPGVSGAGTVTLTQNSELINRGTADMMQLFMVGSPTISTIADFGNTAASPMVLALYAPYSTVALGQTVALTGALVAKSITMGNNAVITYDPRVGGIAGGGIPVYRSTRRWIECTAQPTG